MQPLRRSAESSARRLRPLRQPANRRYAHDAHDSHHASQPVNESLGSGFYIAIAAIPATFAIYKFSAQGTDQKPYFTRLIESYNSWQETYRARNDLHTQMVEQAAADKNLFLNERGTKHVDLRFPEIFNTGAPWNVPAGHGSANIESVVAKYEKEAFEENEKKLQQLREGKIRREQPIPDLAKNTPAGLDS